MVPGIAMYIYRKIETKTTVPKLTFYTSNLIFAGGVIWKKKGLIIVRMKFDRIQTPFVFVVADLPEGASKSSQSRKHLEQTTEAIKLINQNSSYVQSKHT